jgi:hypothetical protein
MCPLRPPPPPVSRGHHVVRPGCEPSPRVPHGSLPSLPPPPANPRAPSHTPCPHTQGLFAVDRTPSGRGVPRRDSVGHKSVVSDGGGSVKSSASGRRVSTLMGNLALGRSVDDILRSPSGSPSGSPSSAPSGALSFPPGSTSGRSGVEAVPPRAVVGPLVRRRTWCPLPCVRAFMPPSRCVGSMC